MERSKWLCVLRAENSLVDSFVDGGVHLDKFIIDAGRLAGRIKFAVVKFFVRPSL